MPDLCQLRLLHVEVSRVEEPEHQCHCRPAHGGKHHHREVFLPPHHQAPKVAALGHHHEPGEEANTTDKFMWTVQGPSSCLTCDTAASRPRIRTPCRRARGRSARPPPGRTPGRRCRSGGPWAEEGAWARTRGPFAAALDRGTWRRTQTGIPVLNFVIVSTGDFMLMIFSLSSSFCRRATSPRKRGGIRIDNVDK